jgi:hypothetical protein
MAQEIRARNGQCRFVADLVSPTQRSLAEMRKRGYLCDVVERWIARARVRKDLYGIADLLCVKEKDIVAVQTTSRSNMSARVKKITYHENVGAVRQAGIRILVHGWGKNSAGRWTLQEVELS